MAASEGFFVTGGAGYIGSTLLERLAAVKPGARLVVFDNLSSGRSEFIQPLMDSGRVSFVRGDLLTDDLPPRMAGCTTVVHAAANADVRRGETDAVVHFEQNVLATARVLEAMDAANVRDIVFLTTSTVYGEASVVPTPEDYRPLHPISLYGSSKLAAEMLIEAWAGQGDGRRGVLLRFANVVGGRATHGVIPDLVAKLAKDPRELEILGAAPGTRKSYVHVEDCVSGILAAHAAGRFPVDVFNIGSEGATDVKQIADEICRQRGQKDVAYHWTGGTDGGRGWKGDVKVMGLSIAKLQATGWVPRFTSDEAVVAAVTDALAPGTSPRNPRPSGR